MVGALPVTPRGEMEETPPRCVLRWAMSLGERVLNGMRCAALNRYLDPGCSVRLFWVCPALNLPPCVCRSLGTYCREVAESFSLPLLWGGSHLPCPRSGGSEGRLAEGEIGVP